MSNILAIQIFGTTFCKDRRCVPCVPSETSMSTWLGITGKQGAASRGEEAHLTALQGWSKLPKTTLTLLSSDGFEQRLQGGTKHRRNYSLRILTPKKAILVLVSNTGVHAV